MFEIRPRSLLYASACAALALVAACSNAPAAPKEHTLDRESFPVASPQLTNAAYEREYTAEVRAVQYAEIRSRVRGVIQTVFFDEGQSVKADEPLFALNARELQQQVRKAKAETKSAEAELEVAVIEQNNLQLLFEKQVISDAEMALVGSKVESLRAHITESKVAEDQATTSLTFAQVRAPFDGVVNRVRYHLGNLVSEDDLLTTLTDTREVLVYFRLSERDYLEFRADSQAAPRTDVAPASSIKTRTVTLRLADGSTYPEAGTIDAVESEFDHATGNIAVRARFPNPTGLLKHGASGKLVLGNQLDNVLVVPQKSTFEIQGNVYVYALDENNVPRAQRIVTKARINDAFVVESGLTPRDRFVLEGLQRIKEGVAIGISPVG